MFGAPPVGHVMDPQFKPVFLGVMEICMQMQVCSINPIGGLAKGNIQILCISMAGFRGIYQIFRHIFYNSIFPLKMHSNCEDHMILCISMEDLGAYTRSLDTYFL